MAEVNAILREQLERANESNLALTETLRKSDEDLNKKKEEFAKREVDWKEEQEVSQTCLFRIHTSNKPKPKSSQALC